MIDRDVAYSPEELAGGFKEVFDVAIAVASDAHDKQPFADCTELLACAATGERDPVELGLAALTRLTNAGKHS